MRRKNYDYYFPKVDPDTQKMDRVGSTRYIFVFIGFLVTLRSIRLTRILNFSSQVEDPYNRQVSSLALKISLLSISTGLNSNPSPAALPHLWPTHISSNDICIVRSRSPMNPFIIYHSHIFDAEPNSRHITACLLSYEV